MSHVRIRSFSYISGVGEEEPPTKKLVSEAELFIKQLAEKQCNTQISLSEQLSQSKEFTKATEFLPVTSYTKGLSCSSNFQEISNRLNNAEILKAAGLTDDEIQLYIDSLNGDDLLFCKHRNYEKSLLLQRLNEIRKKVKQYKDDSLQKDEEDNEKEKCTNQEHGLNIKPNSVETRLLKFALNNKKSQSLSHPLNIKKIEKQRFENIVGITETDINKFRRKARKLQNRVNAVNSNCNVKQINDLNSETSFSKPVLSNQSKWDKTISETTVATSTKVYTCLPRTYYTIRNGSIIKLTRTDLEKEGIELPKRMTIEEIKRIPKFENYEIGNANKVLYLKNLSNSVKEEDLLQLIYSCTSIKDFALKLMKGKMRGQAFMTFSDENTAGQVLQEINGIYLKNKPIIVQFSKSE